MPACQTLLLFSFLFNMNQKEALLVKAPLLNLFVSLF